MAGWFRGETIQVERGSVSGEDDYGNPTLSKSIVDLADVIIDYNKSQVQDNTIEGNLPGVSIMSDLTLYVPRDSVISPSDVFIVGGLRYRWNGRADVHNSISVNNKDFIRFGRKEIKVSAIDATYGRTNG